MNEYNFTIDTTPLAESVDGVNQNVVLVGKAITEMQAAVVAAEKSATENICKNIDGGFFLLIRSKLSQKIAQYKSAINSRLLSLKETGDAVDRMHNQMDDDLHIIKARYLKLFNGLNKELEARIFEVDRPAMNIDKIRNSLIINRMIRESGSIIFYELDSQKMFLNVSGAHIKSKTSKSINAMTDNVMTSLEYSKKYKDIMSGDAQARETISIPIILSEQESMFEANSYYTQLYSPDTAPTALKNKIENVMGLDCDEIQVNSAGEKDEIRKEYIKKITKEGVDPKIAEYMKKLFDGGAV